MTYSVNGRLLLIWEVWRHKVINFVNVRGGGSMGSFVKILNVQPKTVVNKSENWLNSQCQLVLVCRFPFLPSIPSDVDELHWFTFGYSLRHSIKHYHTQDIRYRNCLKNVIFSNCHSNPLIWIVIRAGITYSQ